METRLNTQRGIALPIALIMFVMMLISSIFLMRSSTNATMMAGNLAYDRAISRSADYGLSIAYDWLNTTANVAATKSNLNNDQAASGYLSSYNTTISYRDAAFWAGSVTVNDPSGNPVQYVIHRMCIAQNCPYNGSVAQCGQNNLCVQSNEATAANAGGADAGSSLSSDADDYQSLPQLHYVITARVPGLRGSSVINQMVVMIGA